MSQPLEEQLIAILSAVEVHSPASFAFADRPFAAEAHGQSPEELHTDHASELVPLVRELRQVLYSQCYARHFDGSLSELSPVYDPEFVPDSRLAEQLAEANQSRYGWDPGWKIFRLGAEGEVQVQKGERFCSPQTGEYAYTAGPGMRPRIGDTVSLQVLRESHEMQPGMYFVFGEVLSDRFDEFHQIRFYFHLRPPGAPILVRTLTTALNRYQVPFQFKCQKYRENYDRLDASVLYVAHRYFDICARALTNPPSELTGELEPAIPLFTKMFRPGIGLAEDPVGNLSFGQDRCQLIAEGIVDAWLRDESSAAASLQCIQTRFEARGLSLDKPYLNAGSVDVYDSPQLTGIDR